MKLFSALLLAMLSSFSVAVPLNQRSAENNWPDCFEEEQNGSHVVDEKPENNGTNLVAPTPINVDTPGDKLPWLEGAPWRKKTGPHGVQLATSLFGTAFGYSLRYNKGDGWVYKIHPTPNMIDLDASNFTLEWSNEEELSGLGGIRWDQVEAWMAIPNNVTGKAIGVDDPYKFREEETFIAKFPEQKWIKNEEYNPKYDQFTGSGGQPQLAGDDFNLEKYKEKTLEQWAFEFLDKNGEPVGWTGAFPFVGPAEIDPVRKI